MGCIFSSMDDDERVQLCKERRKLMKQLLRLRADFATSIMAYLKSLKNTGVALNQFTEFESLELENNPIIPGLRPSPRPRPPKPPLPLPPPPPPPPPPIDSPDSRESQGVEEAEGDHEKMSDIGDDNGSIVLSTPINNLSSASEGLQGSLARDEGASAIDEDVDEENWAETASQFEEEDHYQEHVPSKALSREVKISVLSTGANANATSDDGSIMRSNGKKMRDDMAMVVWRSTAKTLVSVVRELDDYFLKASGGGRKIAVLVDLTSMNTGDPKERKGKNSAKVLGSLSRRWTSRSMLLALDNVESSSPPFEPCGPGAHCKTLEKLYGQEEILYKAVKEEELAKLELEQKSLVLQKQQDNNADMNKIEKTQSAVESLQSDIVQLQELVLRTSSFILAIINEELHPQLTALISGLIHMWRTMYECHIAQIRICQKLKHLINNRNTRPTTEDHQNATLQLENEVNLWHNSFCRLLKCQRQYVSVLSRWIQLTESLETGENGGRGRSMARLLCEKWQLALDRLPEQVISDAMKGFLLVIRSMLIQQEKEFIHKKKSDKLDRKLQKELNSLFEYDRKLEESGISGSATADLSPRHPLSVKRAKVVGLRKQYEEEKAKYLNAVQETRAMTLKDLFGCLPGVFQALTGFSGACVQAFEAALGQAGQASDVGQSSATANES